MLSHPAIEHPKVATPRERDAMPPPVGAAVGRRLIERLQRHWPEYLMEGAELGLFMVSACLFGMLLYANASPMVAWIPSFQWRTVLMGCAMGLTNIALVYSPWGKQSGAHMNPAVSLTFWRLGKVHPVDAMCYAVSQTLGGILGVLLTASAFGTFLAAPEVNYVATVPGTVGPWTAWLVEFAISGILMFTVLTVSNVPAIARFTGLCAGGLVAFNIVVAATLSGMSMNPARSLASALPSGTWTAFWIYLTAPPLAMLSAAEVYLWWRGRQSVTCAKLHHQNRRRCIFCRERASLEA
jgi:aquaporin Z